MVLSGDSRVAATGGGGRVNSPRSAREEVRRALRTARVRLPDLFKPGARLVVGFSGGQDSTALLHALAHAHPKLDIIAAHVDHQLQPNSAQTAERVAQLAASLNVPCTISRVDVGAYRKRLPNGWSVQQAARAARYQAFAEVVQEHHAAALLVAHTADDQAETLLLHLLRGSGLTGMTGMRLAELIDIHRLGPPLESPPLERPPNEDAPIQELPVESPPIESLRIESPPLQSLPLESLPLESPPLQSLPLQSLPLESRPLEAAPNERTSTDTPPMNNTRVDCTPIDKPPMNNPPMENTSEEADKRGRRAHPEPLQVVRPLLRISRATTLAYCTLHHLPIVEDGSNQSRAYTRNRVRLDLMPMLEQFNPAIRTVLARTAELAAEDEAALETLIGQPQTSIGQTETSIGQTPAFVGQTHTQLGEQNETFRLDLWRAQNRAVQRRLLRRSLNNLLGALVDIGDAPIEDALDLVQSAQPNQTYHLPYGVELCVGAQDFSLQLHGRARPREARNTWESDAPRV